MDKNREKIVNRLDTIRLRELDKAANINIISSYLSKCNDIESILYAQNCIKVLDDIISYIGEKDEYDELRKFIRGLMETYYLNYEVDFSDQEGEQL